SSRHTSCLLSFPSRRSSDLVDAVAPLDQPAAALPYEPVVEAQVARDVHFHALQRRAHQQHGARFGDRALAEARAMLLVRSALQGVEVDVTCYLRFYDWLVRQGGRWLIERRNGIYEIGRAS